MRFFVLISLLSFNLFADDFSTFEQYKGNFPLLVKDLARIETLASTSGSPQYNELLKDMTTYKEQYDYLLNPLDLKSFYQDTKDNKWKNLEKMTKALLPICDDKKTFNLEHCKSELEKMRMFSEKSNLSTDTKEEIAGFLDAYILQVNAYGLIDAEFITQFNKNVEYLNSKAKESVAETIKIPSDIDFSSDLDTETKKFALGKKEYILMAIGVLLLGFLIRFFLKPKKRDATKKFYAILFSIAKKNHIQLKIFGNLSPGEVKTLEKVQMPLLNTVYLSRSVSSMAQIKFKRRGKSIAVEINYATTRGIQSVMEIPKEKAFKDSVIELQKAVEANGGEFSVTNNFNAKGELSHSNLLFHLPK